MDKLDKTDAGRTMKARYKANKQAKVKEKIICPVCGKEFVKQQYSQAFCCTVCKDDYHNARKPNRHKDGRAYYREYNSSRRGDSYQIHMPEQDYINACAHYGDDDY
jgi:ribosomal protein L37AE/L43A